jgi:histidinol-phosphate/aromatic aminotransferase/cobyric acid decarboxylase-like protein
MTQPEIAKEIYKAKLPYNVNVFTLAAVEVLMENKGVMDEAVNCLIAERERVYAELQKRRGVESFASHANFILIRTGKPAREMFDALYAQGVLVRNVSSYPMLDRALRITIGSPSENNRFLEALDQALDDGVD